MRRNEKLERSKQTMRKLSRFGVVTGIMIGSIFFGLPSVVTSEASIGLDLGRQSLRGLEGVHIIVRNLPAEIESKGLTKESLQKDVESKLNQAKIKVLSAREALFTEGAPSLDLDVKISELRHPSEKISGYIYSIGVTLAQAVILGRDPKIALHADTWKLEDYGQASKLDEIRAKIKDMIDRFVISYQAANAANTEEKAVEFSPGSLEEKGMQLKTK
jgi:hypothetical protein